MTTQSNSTAPETGEAQALLSKVAPKGKITNGADAYLFDMRGPALMKSLITSVAELERERDALREALRFYADPRKYEGPNQRADPDEVSAGPFRIDVTRDGGRRARAALGETK
jgi:hypothetical protein